MLSVALDIDDCLTQTACPADTTCMDLLRDFRCECASGFTTMGQHENTTCVGKMTNSPGSAALL